MSLTVLITYAGALFIAAAIPGPGITAIVARALGVLVPYMLLASRARTMLKQPRALQALNRVASGILAGTAAFIATRAA
ncbi:hypothetical protein [Rhizobium leguminosarum]|uniref:hypothetical protein n=1 Tax=Rhizobium leguminosarum TaxID=384 RepID=UPI003F973E95